MILPIIMDTWIWIWIPQVIHFLLCVDMGQADNFTVGYLYTDRTQRYVKVKQGRIISGAMTYAVQTVSLSPTG